MAGIGAIEPSSRDGPTAYSCAIADPCRRHEHSNRTTQWGSINGKASTHAQAWFCAPELSAIRAVRATPPGERGCKLSIPMARIVSRYNQRARQAGFEDEASW